MLRFWGKSMDWVEWAEEELEEKLDGTSGSVVDDGCSRDTVVPPAGGAADILSVEAVGDSRCKWCSVGFPVSVIIILVEGWAPGLELLAVAAAAAVTDVLAANKLAVLSPERLAPMGLWVSTVVGSAASAAASAAAVAVAVAAAVTPSLGASCVPISCSVASTGSVVVATLLFTVTKALTETSENSTDAPHSRTTYILIPSGNIVQGRPEETERIWICRPWCKTFKSQTYFFLCTRLVWCFSSKVQI